MFAIPLLYLKALIFNWVGIFGILLTLAPLFQPWVEKKALKKQVSLKHLWIAGLICLFFASYEAWKDEHARVDQLFRENQTVVNERDFWKDQSYQKDTALRARDQLLGQNFATLNATQQALASLSNKVLEIAKPEPLKITIGMGGALLKSKDGYKDNQFLVFANKVIRARGQFSCDQKISDIHAFVVGSANLYVGGSQEAGGAFIVGEGSLAQIDT
jgi:hypothetical protein